LAAAGEVKRRKITSPAPAMARLLCHPFFIGKTDQKAGVFSFCYSHENSKKRRLQGCFCCFLASFGGFLAKNE
jgi:hypothetical protein